MKPLRLWLPVLACAVVLVAACARSDADLTTNVKAQLAADEVIKARPIDVETKDRVVTLTGQVQNGMERLRAAEIARATHGVDGVIDRLTIGPQSVPTSGSTSGGSR